MKKARYLWLVLLLAVLALLAVLLIGNFERGVPEVEEAATAVEEEDGKPSEKGVGQDFLKSLFTCGVTLDVNIKNY